MYSSCSVKSKAPGSSTSNAGTTTNVTLPPAVGGTTTTRTSPDSSCGVTDNNCYYSTPTIQVMGVTPANAGATIWTSKSLGPGYQAQFVTDAVFNVRIIPRMAIKTNPPVNPSVPGKSCNHTMTKIATKLFLQLKLQTKEEDLANGDGEVATLSASIDEPSKVWHFKRRVTATNLVLKVATVLSDSRVQQGVAGYGPFSDIPINTPNYAYLVDDYGHLKLDSAGHKISAYPTECVAFDIQFSTDDTIDLPGAKAN